MARRRKAKPVSLASIRALAEVPTTTLSAETLPTPERLQQAGCTVAMQLGTGRLQIIGRAQDGLIGADGIVRLAQAPLDRLHNRNRLDADPERNLRLFEAGHTLRRHHFLAGLSGYAANDLHGGGGGQPASRTPITETMEKSRRRLRIAQSAMNAGDWHVVYDVVCEETTLEAAGRRVGFGNDEAAVAVALDRLRRGLGELAVLWGYVPPPRPLQPGAAANDPVAAEAAA